MNANLLLEGWKIRKRIESDGYLGCKFRVAESMRTSREGTSGTSATARRLEAGEGKSRYFWLSQALANPVVQKAACSDLDLCDLSSPVWPRLKMVSQHTF
jgi:hypothetical protein